MNPPSKDELTRVSVHEAGHFVLGRAIGFDATEMHLTENGRGRYSGYVKFKHSRADDILNAEREGISLDVVRNRWGVTPEEFDRLYLILSAKKLSLVQKLMTRALSGPAADCELGGGDETIGESDFMDARNLALTAVPESLVTELMKKVFNEARLQAKGPARVAILTAAERLRRRRHFDTAALAKLWHEVCPGPWHGLGKIEQDPEA